MTPGGLGTAKRPRLKRRWPRSSDDFQSKSEPSMPLPARGPSLRARPWPTACKANLSYIPPDVRKCECAHTSACWRVSPRARWVYASLCRCFFCSTPLCPTER